MGKQLNAQAKGNLKIVGIAIGVMVVLSLVVGFFLFGKEKKQQVVLSSTGPGVGGMGGDRGTDAFQYEEYQKKIDEKDKQKVAQAVASGGSAVPTLTPPGVNKKNNESGEPFGEIETREGKKTEGDGRRSVNGSYDVPPPPKGGENEGYVYGKENQGGDHQGRNTRADATMRELNNQWALPQQAIAFSGKDSLSATAAPAAAVSATGSTAPPVPAAAVLIEKGTMCYAVIESYINSDESKAMVSATLASCQGVKEKSFNGARVFGNIERSGETVVVHFTTMNLAKKGYSIDAVAFDEKTGRGALSGDVDRHTFVRYWLPAITEIMGGLGAASMRDNTSTVTSLSGTTTSQGELSDKSKFLFAIGKGGETVNKVVQDSYKGKEITVKIPSGIGVGILFVGNVTASSDGL